MLRPLILILGLGTGVAQADVPAAVQDHILPSHAAFAAATAARAPDRKHDAAEHPAVVHPRHPVRAREERPQPPHLAPHTGHRPVWRGRVPANAPATGVSGL